MPVTLRLNLFDRQAGCYYSNEACEIGSPGRYCPLLVGVRDRYITLMFQGNGRASTRICTRTNALQERHAIYYTTEALLV